MNEVLDNELEQRIVNLENILREHAQGIEEWKQYKKWMNESMKSPFSFLDNISAIGKVGQIFNPFTRQWEDSTGRLT